MDGFKIQRYVTSKTAADLIEQVGHQAGNR
jgi:hypothetical protein